jgi:hypothetical protein
VSDGGQPVAVGGARPAAPGLEPDAIGVVQDTVIGMASYRRLIASGPLDALVLGILPLAAAGFLGWIVIKTLLAAPAAQLWSVLGVFVVGLALLATARFIQRPPFFQLPRQQWEQYQEET